MQNAHLDVQARINPLLAEGQVLGGAVQGLGASLSEQVVHDDDGLPVASSLLDYALPTAADVPEIETAYVETPTPLNPLGAKGIGESGAIGVPPAIANALADALGVHLDPPFTAETVWRAAGGDPPFTAETVWRAAGGGS